MSIVNDNSVEPCCSETVSTTNLTSSTLLRDSEPTREPSNEVWYTEATAPVARTACPSQPCCSEAVSTTNLPSSALPNVDEPTYQPTNEVLSRGATAPVACTACPLRPTDLSVVAVDHPNHSPGSLPSGMEPEEYTDYKEYMDQMDYIDNLEYMQKCVEMRRCHNGLRSASDVATPMTPAIHCQQQQTHGAARCADSHGSMQLSHSTDQLASGLQPGAPDGDLCSAAAFHPRDTDENGYMHMSCQVRVRV